eukprot:TRINITY_DN4765_c0_g2_i1.p2 TRINITY_DN4765_c0_g2~~TRINITY_DN4765_c0_g2_i1.p2  ORF type:complete len:413 (+),score=70.15 TRINITY_DN4765_c0_g2_i1:228-1466(+)
MGCSSSVATRAIDRTKSSHHLMLEHVPLDTSLQGSFTSAAPTFFIPTLTTHEFKQRYDLMAVIGNGAFADVWHAVDQDSEQAVAIKISKERRCRNCLKEAKLLRSLGDEFLQPHVAPLLNCVYVSRQIHLITPYAKKGDLFTFVDQHEGQIPENLAQHLFHGLADATRFCHQHGIAHNDIKPENVVLCSTEEWYQEHNMSVSPSPWCTRYPIYAQLIDFGEAQPFDGDTLATDLVGSPDYLAPEVIKRRYHPAKADCWSLGVTLYLMLTDTLPFMAPTQELTELRVRTLHERLTPAIAHRVSKACIAAVLGLLRRDVSRRLSSDLLWHHPWLVDYRADNSVLQGEAFGRASSALRSDSSSSYSIATTPDDASSDLGAFTSSPLAHSSGCDVKIPTGTDLAFYLADADKSTSL